MSKGNNDLYVTDISEEQDMTYIGVANQGEITLRPTDVFVDFSILEQKEPSLICWSNDPDDLFIGGKESDNVLHQCFIAMVKACGLPIDTNRNVTSLEFQPDGKTSVLVYVNYDWPHNPQTDTFVFFVSENEPLVWDKVNGKKR